MSSSAATSSPIGNTAIATPSTSTATKPTIDISDATCQIVKVALQAALKRLSPGASGFEEFTLEVCRSSDSKPYNFTSITLPTVLQDELQKLQEYARTASKDDTQKPDGKCLHNSYEKVWLWKREREDHLKDHRKLLSRVNKTCECLEKAGTNAELVDLYNRYSTEVIDHIRIHENIKTFIESEATLDLIGEYGLVECKPVCDVTDPTFCTTIMGRDIDILGLVSCAAIVETYRKELRQLSSGL